MKDNEILTPENLEKLGMSVWSKDNTNLYEMGSGFDSVYYFIDSKLLIVKIMNGRQKHFDNIITVGDMRKILDKYWYH